MKKLEKKYKDIEEAFNAADVDNSGTLTIKEVRMVFPHCCFGLTDRRNSLKSAWRKAV